MKIRANRDGRKTSLCEAYSSCGAYAFDSLQSLFTDNRAVAAQEYNYPDSTYSLAERCWQGVLLLGSDLCWLHQLHPTCLSSTLKGISPRRG